MKRSKSLWLAAFAAVASMAAMNAYADTASITGAGSTWVYPLIAKWSAAYSQKTGIQVNYQPIGSGGGIAQIEAGTVSFGASDKPLKPEELRKHGLIQFPTAVAGADMVYNIPGIDAGKLVLSGGVVADMYLGKITNWNDPAIQKLNPGLSLPDMAITCVHRSDGSGTTFTFANYLCKVSPEWKTKIGANTSLAWPTGVGGKGNEGVASYVQRIKGSVGYVEYAYIVENNMDYAKMINRAGRAVSPSLKGFQDAAGHVNFNKAKDFYVILTDKPGPETWPISGCTWEILSAHAAKSVNEPVVKFFMWGFHHGQSMARAISFGPLPSSTIKVIKSYVRKNTGV